MHCDGIILTPGQEMGRLAAVEKAKQWRADQAARLGLDEKDISDAVRRGWPGDWIADLLAVDVALLSGPPLPPETIAAVKIAQDTPVEDIAFGTCRRKKRN